MFLVGQPRFEPGTPSPPDLYANQLRYCPTKTTTQRSFMEDNITINFLNVNEHKINVVQGINVNNQDV